jgi:type II secretory pathway pseudopilin PulG
MKPSLKSNAKPDVKAFTIIELLVAVGVTALMVSLMLTIVVNVLGGWNRSSGSLTSGNQARQIMDRITQDIQSAILKRDGNVWMAVNIQTNKGNPEWQGTGQNTVLHAPALEDSRFGPYSTWFRFVSTVPDTNDGTLAKISAPRAVGYQIIRRPVVAGSDEIRYLLFRSEVSPDITFATGYNITSGAYSTVTPNAGLTAGSIRSPELDQVIANNVVDFGVRFYVSERSPATGLTNLRVIYPAAPAQSPNASGQPTAPLTGSLSTQTSGTQIAHLVRSGVVDPNDHYRNAFPNYVDVMVRILTDEGVTQISNLENGLISGDWWDIVLANSKVYTRRIEIKGTGL